jgi:aryl-alcohol dehydrogenase-like predicted oxidoreductase
MRYLGDEGLALGDEGLALGVTLFDTAEIYGFGKSERVLGEALGDKRTAVAVANKITSSDSLHFCRAVGGTS